jgi:hypothetical protein
LHEGKAKWVFIGALPMRNRVRQLTALQSGFGQPDHGRGGSKFSCRADPLGTVAFQ